MIVCVLDDLLFSIKIKTAAKQLGVEIHFERSRENVLATVREKRPSLVIFDLNSSRMAPMEAIAAMKADPELKRVMTLGYVSHVDSEAIAAARRAGIDQVLARSTFTERLGAILNSSNPLL
jgi:PleD family two-component response regulator